MRRDDPESVNEDGGASARLWRAVILSVVMSCVMLGALAAVVWKAPWRGATGVAAARSAGAGLAELRSSRAAALHEAWRIIDRFEAAEGRAPASMEELRRFEAVIDDVLAAPAHAAAGDYRIDFGALAETFGRRRASGEEAEDGAQAARPGPALVVIADPGYALPGIGAGEPGTLTDVASFRLALLTTGEVVDYATARRRGVPLPED